MADDEEPGWAKIEFTQEPNDLFQYGPTTKIGIAPAGANVSVAQVFAQIDTGASITCISLNLAKKLGMEPIDFGFFQEATAKPERRPVYRARLFLPGAEIDMDVVGLTSLDAPHEALIGRDILANCRLAIDFISGVVGLHMRAD